MNADNIGSTVKNACTACVSAITSILAKSSQSALGSAAASVASYLLPQAGSSVVSQSVVKKVAFAPHISGRKADKVLSSPEKKANFGEVSRDTPFRSPIRTTDPKGRLPMEDIPEELEVAVQQNSMPALTKDAPNDRSPSLPNRR